MLQEVLEQSLRKWILTVTTMQFLLLHANFKDHEKNYSPFLLEAAAAVWGMDIFNKYFRGKQFILFTDHKPLEKLGHLHTKMLNRLQAALLEHDFVVQYKKDMTMPADYLSTFPSFPVDSSTN